MLGRSLKLIPRSLNKTYHIKKMSSSSKSNKSTTNENILLGIGAVAGLGSWVLAGNLVGRILFDIKHSDDGNY